MRRMILHQVLTTPLGIKKTVGLPLGKAFIQLINSKNKVLINRFLSLFREKANEAMPRDTLLHADTVNTLR